MIRRLAGLGLVAAAGWLLWQGIHTVDVFMARGGSLASALFEPPTGVFRIVSTALAVTGGLLALVSRPGGAWFGAAGALIFALLAVLLAAAGADISLWRDEAIWTGVLALLAGMLVFLRRS